MAYSHQMYLRSRVSRLRAQRKYDAKKRYEELIERMFRRAKELGLDYIPPDILDEPDEIDVSAKERRALAQHKYYINNQVRLQTNSREYQRVKRATARYYEYRITGRN